MSWYSAHIITYVQFIDGIQDKYPVWENIVLIDADSEDQAYEIAENIGKSDYHGSPLSWDGRPATWAFAGIRKLVKCQDIPSKMIERRTPDWRPDHGTEVTYLQLEVPSEEALSRFVQGSAVTVLYEE
jgi:hypothetical protein